MNRRTFFKSTVGAVAAAACAPLLGKAVPAAVDAGFQAITYKGVPFVFSQHARANTLYFVNPNTWMWNTFTGEEIKIF